MLPEKITKGWRHDVWRDHLSLEIVRITITPEDDLELHIDSPDCECIPEVKESEGIPTLIHNSFDGRELQEKDERGN